MKKFLIGIILSLLGAALIAGCGGELERELDESTDAVLACACNATHTGPAYDACCSSSRFCSRDGICTLDRDVGGSCNRNAQCIAGLTCTNGQCDELGSGDPGGIPGDDDDGSGHGGDSCHSDPACAMCNADGDECLIYANQN